MASFVITATSTVQQNLLNGEYGYIATGGELVVAGADAIVGSGSVQLAVLGNLTSFGDFNAFNFDGVDLDMVVGAAGSVLSISDNALDLVASSRIELTNLGAINADGIAISAATSDTGTAMNIFNAGTINGSSAISASSGTGTLLITNTGSMFTNGTTISVSSSTGPTVLNNSGTIESFGSFAVFFSAGNDRIVNTGTIIGNVLLGVGNDTYDGTAGYVQGRVDGSTGNDTIIGGEFAETFRGGNDEDTITAGGGNDIIEGTDFDNANDIFDGGDGVDTLEVNADGNNLIVDLDAGFASGGLFGLDTLISIENVVSGNGNDLLIGNDVDNFLDGGANDDTLLGGAGRDTVLGGTGDDTLRGEAGDDILRGDAGADILQGGSGVDHAVYNNSDAAVEVDLAAGTGLGGHAEGDTLSSIERVTGSNSFSDRLFGNAADNTLRGNGGDDTLRGEAGADSIIGGSGSDWSVYVTSDAAVEVDLATGTGIGGHAEGDTLSGIEKLSGSSAFGDKLFGDGADNTLRGNGGDDTLRGEAGADSIIGGSGSDWSVYVTSDAAVEVDLATGTGIGGHAEGDTLSGIEKLSGSSAFGDKLFGDAADNTLRGNGGDDTLRGEAGADSIIGGSGSDWSVYVTSDAAVTVDLATGTGLGGHAEGDTLSGIEKLSGSSGFGDMLLGNGSDNILRGNGGNDTLNGRLGNDTLLGGSGNDTFVFEANWGNDTVNDFNVAGNEVLDFSSLGISQGDLSISYGASDTTITFAGNQIDLTGSTATLLSDDFAF